MGKHKKNKKNQNLGVIYYVALNENLTHDEDPQAGLSPDKLCSYEYALNHVIYEPDDIIIYWAGDCWAWKR